MNQEVHHPTGAFTSDDAPKTVPVGSSKVADVLAGDFNLKVLYTLACI